MAAFKRNDDPKHYFKEIKSLFPTFGENEKKYLESFKTDVEECTDTLHDLTYLQLVSQFGDPNVIVSEYLAEADPEYLKKRIRVSKHVRVMAVVVIVAVIAASLIWAAVLNKLYAEAKAAMLSVKEITIEQES